MMNTSAAKRIAALKALIAERKGVDSPEALAAKKLGPKPKLSPGRPAEPTE